MSTGSQKIFDEFWKEYPHAPNPIHEPKKFEHYLKLFVYEQKRKEKNEKN